MLKKRVVLQVVMFDCGVHPAHSGMSCLPYFDHINPAEVGLGLGVPGGLGRRLEALGLSGAWFITFVR